MKWLKNLWSDYKTMKLNKKNFKQFVKEAEDLYKEDDSILNQYGIKFSDDKTKLSTLITIPEQFSQYPDERVIQLKLNEYLNPVSHYMWWTMNWVEFLRGPQTFHIEDEQTEGIKEGQKFSLTYLAIWEFTGVDYINDSWPSFWRWFKFACGFIGVLAVSGAALAAIMLL